jgi:hypothetical protein
MIYERLIRAVEDLGTRWTDLENASQGLANVLPVGNQRTIVTGWVTQAQSLSSLAKSALLGLQGFPPVPALLQSARTIFDRSRTQFDAINTLAFGIPPTQGILQPFLNSQNRSQVETAAAVESALRNLQRVIEESLQEIG